MESKKIIKFSFLHALGAVAYITLIATFMTNAEKGLFGKSGGVLTGIGFLLIFTVSAAVMGLLIFGRPIIWYLDGMKKEALALALGTIAFLGIITSIVLFILILG